MATSDPAGAPAALLWTKLYKPQAGPELVRRPRLESRLDRGPDRRLVLISAPAGLGKTTLVSQARALGILPPQQGSIPASQRDT